MVTKQYFVLLKSWKTIAIQLLLNFSVHIALVCACASWMLFGDVTELKIGVASGSAREKKVLRIKSATADPQAALSSTMASALLLTQGL